MQTLERTPTSSRPSISVRQMLRSFREEADREPARWVFCNKLDQQIRFLGS
jgi:hypothetical protein